MTRGLYLAILSLILVAALAAGGIALAVTHTSTHHTACPNAQKTGNYLDYLCKR